jgi:DNA topoisomerase IB
VKRKIYMSSKSSVKPDSNDAAGQSDTQAIFKNIPGLCKSCHPGRSCLKDKHVAITGSTIRFSFTSKKGVNHDITLKSKRLGRIVKMLEMLSIKLGNIRTVCKKYYVHPGLIALYEENNLNKYLAGLDELEKPDDKTGLHADEPILMKILQSFHKN